MTKLYQNKYRITSTRLQNWNYANEAKYFITICSKNRGNYFGVIVDGILQPTVMGKIACSEWFCAIEIRPDMKLELSEFIVLPNHIHGIIIGRNDYNAGSPGFICRDAMYRVSTNETDKPIRIR